MQKTIIPFLIALALSGCAMHNKSAGDNFLENTSREEAAWKKLNELSPTQCGTSTSPPERDKALGMSDCVTELVKVYVLPNAVSPRLLLASRAKAFHIAEDYARGDISAAEYRIEAGNRIENYRSSLLSLTSQNVQTVNNETLSQTN